MRSRHPTPSPRGESPRPATFRKRSSSVPMRDALGCSTPEAELVLREGRAAVRNRQARRRAHREMDSYRPRDHLKYLDQESAISDSNERLSSPNPRSRRHSRIPSDATDRSTSTIIAPVQPSVDDQETPTILAGRPLGDYSANLAKFIRSQLSSIPSYDPTRSSISPSSCPDLSFPSRTPPQSPTKSIRRPLDVPHSIEIPSVRPPLKSAFSAWTPSDEDTDDEMPALPSGGVLQKTGSYTSSVLGYYENSSSFLFSCTPLEEPLVEEDDPDTAKGPSFPNQEELLLPSAGSQSASSSFHGDYPSSGLSPHPQLTSSSAPSFSSISTGSYFESKRELRDRIIAAVTPPLHPRKVVATSSPFEGQSLANLHDITVDDNMRRVLVDGMSFDMVRDFAMPDEGMMRVSTPC
jgi:hypothetical protein